jgi:hypothetical protein
MLLGHFWWRGGIGVLMGRRRLHNSGAEDGDGTVVLALLSLHWDRADEVSVQ